MWKILAGITLSGMLGLRIKGSVIEERLPV